VPGLFWLLIPPIGLARAQGAASGAVIAASAGQLALGDCRQYVRFDDRRLGLSFVK
jgi:hypothetical protein